MGLTCQSNTSLTAVVSAPVTEDRSLAHTSGFTKLQRRLEQEFRMKLPIHTLPVVLSRKKAFALMRTGAAARRMLRARVPPSRHEANADPSLLTPTPQLPSTARSLAAKQCKMKSWHAGLLHVALTQVPSSTTPAALTPIRATMLIM